MAGMNEADARLLATAIVYGSPTVIDAVGIKLSVAEVEYITESARRAFDKASITSKELLSGIAVVCNDQADG